MILRRLTEHVKAQNWFAVVLDFLIVVAGVFVGMQVSNWNAGRADRATAARHLTEIAEDLQSHLAMHDDLYGAAVARIAAVDYIYDKAFGRELPRALTLSVETWAAPEIPPIAADKRDNLMGAINLVRVNVGSRSGYQSLISSGHLGLIGDEKLARSLQLYYAGFDDLLQAHEVFRVFRNDGAPAFYPLGVSLFDERPADEIVALARDNPDFAAYLRSVRELAFLHANLLDRLRAQTQTLLAAIRSALEESR